MAAWDEYYQLVGRALEEDAFGDLDAMESAVLRLRAGVHEPRRDIDEVAVKLGVSREWVRLVEEMLVDRLEGSSWWPPLQASIPPGPRLA
jgi:DNA-directed RNA polymerase sigma subunit (sigma70/sigma32)